MITRETLVASRWSTTAHIDCSNCYENHFVNETWPRLTCVVRGPRGRRAHPKLGKFFFVDGVEVTKCSELIERLSSDPSNVVPIGTPLALALQASDDRASVG